jgi:hypothetical protein
VEECRLSSFPGNYGAGKTIKTLSLLPGEKTKVVIKTYTRTTTTAKAASSIFDSFNKSSADDFQKGIESEQTDKEAAARTDAWSVEAEVSGRWGTGKAKVSGGYKGSANSSREQLAKNVTKATQKHAATASSKRDVKVEQSKESKTESGDEEGLEREIHNVNVGHTLNFVFRQMNQEYVSLLHLTDVKIAFTWGAPTRGGISP